MRILEGIKTGSGERFQRLLAELLKSLLQSTRPTDDGKTWNLIYHVEKAK